MNILTIVTVAPRKGDTLPQCLTSLVDAGFDPVWVFAEPETPKPPVIPGWNPNTHFLEWKDKKGAWFNWRESTGHILNNYRQPWDALFYVQDDIVMHPDSKRFIEKAFWPDPNCGMLSIYTPSHYSLQSGNVLKKPGFFEMQVPTIYGACALFFPRKVVEKFAETRIWHSWMGLPPQTNGPTEFELRKKDPSRIKHVDAGITRILIELNKTLWYLTPSLAQHISTHSTLGHAPSTGKRMADPVANFCDPIRIPYPEKIYNI